MPLKRRIGPQAAVAQMDDTGAFFFDQFLIMGGSKVAGIMAWLAYWLKTSRMFLCPLLEAGAGPSAP